MTDITCKILLGDLEQDITWSSTKVNFRTFVVQYFHMRYVLLS